MSIWERIKLAWRVIFKGDIYDPMPNLFRSIEKLDHTELTGAVKLAFDKLKSEPVYPGRPRIYDMGSPEQKRKEVREWAYRYARTMGIEDISDWHINFWLELLVGIDKGRL